MTLQLDWPQEAVERVKREAEKRGLTVDAYLLQAALPEEKDVATDSEARRRRREKAVADIRELRKGNILGPDLTIRDLIEEGRRF